MARKPMTAAQKKAFVQRMAAARAKKGELKSNPRKRKTPARKVKRVSKKPVYYILIKRGGKRGYWTGKEMDARISFDTELSKAMPFRDPSQALFMAHQIKHIPKGWRIYLEKK